MCASLGEDLYPSGHVVQNAISFTRCVCPACECSALDMSESKNWQPHLVVNLPGAIGNSLKMDKVLNVPFTHRQLVADLSRGLPLPHLWLMYIHVEKGG